MHAVTFDGARTYLKGLGDFPGATVPAEEYANFKLSRAERNHPGAHVHFSDLIFYTLSGILYSAVQRRKQTGQLIEVAHVPLGKTFRSAASIQGKNMNTIRPHEPKAAAH